MQGQPGVQGQPGTPGAPGPQGPAGTAGVITVRSEVRTGSGSGSAAGGGIQANCLAGEKAIGGGGVGSDGDMRSNAPVLTAGDPTGWRVVWRNDLGGNPGNGTYTVYVICAGPPPAP